MVPSTTRSQLAAFSLVTWALKSWSVGLWVTVSAILSFIFSACICTPSSTSLPKSVSWYIAQRVFFPFWVTVAGGAVDLRLVEGLVHRARGGEREEVRHPRVELVFEERVVHRGAEAGHHREDAVALDGLGPRLHRARDLVLGVLDDEPD